MSDLPGTAASDMSNSVDNSYEAGPDFPPESDSPDQTDFCNESILPDTDVPNVLDVPDPPNAANVPDVLDVLDAPNAADVPDVPGAPNPADVPNALTAVYIHACPVCPTKPVCTTRPACPYCFVSSWSRTTRWVVYAIVCILLYVGGYFSGRALGFASCAE